MKRLKIISLSKQQGFSLIELVIAMLVISMAVLSYEIILYRSQVSEATLRDDAELIETVNNRFNEYLITGNLDTSGSTTVNVIQSGSGWVFQSANDNSISMEVDLPT